MDTKRAHGTIDEDVDVMILDFLVADALRTLLSAAQALLSGLRYDEDACDKSLTRVNDFLTIFKSKHSRSAVEPDQRFRLDLLKFMTIFLSHLTKSGIWVSEQSLAVLRARNTRISNDWRQIKSMTPTKAPCRLEISAIMTAYARLERASPLSKVPHNNAVPRLLDLLPSFMILAAEVKRSAPSDRWIELAADFCLQAVLEQVSIDGTVHAEDVGQAFSWGSWEHCTDDVTGNMTDDVRAVHDMFWDERTQDEDARWTEARLQRLQAIDPRNGVDLEKLINRHPVEDLERGLLEFMTALPQSVPRPVISSIKIR